MIIKVQGLSKLYGNKIAVENLNFSVKKGIY